MNREQYESLKAVDLKEIAKNRGVKSATRYKKEDLIELMLKLDEDEAEKAKPAEKAPEKEKKSTAQEEKKPARRPGRPAKNARSLQEENHSAAAHRQETVKTTEHVQEERPSEERPAPAAEEKAAEEHHEKKIPQYDDARPCEGFLEVLTDGYGFLRSNGFMSGDNDIYVSPSQIRRFNLKTGDVVTGSTRKNNPNDKFGALLYIDTINGMNPEVAAYRPNFEDLTPIFPNERIRLETPGAPLAVRIIDFISPIGKGQRGMIVSQPKAGKTTLLKQIAKSVTAQYPDMHLIILLIDERPEEVTDMKESVTGDNVSVVYSTFDELPEHHKRVSEMVIARAKRLVEQGQDVMILLDSITRLARAYNLTVTPSGKTLSGGLDPTALYSPKRFFGAARNMREGGSLTILATALVDTGSKMDDVVFEEFKGTGNMELVLDRKLSEKRVFPAIDLARSSTRREDLLLSKEELVAADYVRKALSGLKKEEAGEAIVRLFSTSKTNLEFTKNVILRRGVF